MVETTPRPGGKWIVFAGVLMILAGGSMFINGLWALDVTNQVEKSFGDTLLFSSSNLDTWGWIYLIVGAVVVVAGILVFFRSTFGMMIGIAAAVVQALLSFFWIFSPYWPAALVIIVLDLLVIYALSWSPIASTSDSPLSATGPWPALRRQGSVLLGCPIFRVPPHNQGDLASARPLLVGGDEAVRMRCISSRRASIAASTAGVVRPQSPQHCEASAKRDSGSSSDQGRIENRDLGTGWSRNSAQECSSTGPPRDSIGQRGPESLRRLGGSGG
jgi:hypothetical protein